MKRFYLLSYCTPSRAGQHLVRIEASKKDGDDEATGALEYEFKAEGFGPPPDCDPETKPAFDMKAPMESGGGSDSGGGAKGNVSVEANVGK